MGHPNMALREKLEMAFPGGEVSEHTNIPEKQHAEQVRSILLNIEQDSQA